MNSTLEVGGGQSYYFKMALQTINTNPFTIASSLEHRGKERSKT